VAAWYRGQLGVVKYYLDALDVDGVKLVTVDLYQGEDNDFVILDLTATTQEAAIMMANDQALWQEASAHLTTENRLCMALTRARYGCAIVGGAQCLLNTLAGKDKGIGLVACIEDAMSRNIMVNDQTEDESDYVQKVFRNSAGYATFMQNSSMQTQFAWMTEYRHQMRGERKTAHSKKSYGRPNSARVTYSGPEEGTQLSTFPPDVRKLVETRQKHPDAKAPKDKQNIYDSGKRSGRKPKSQKTATAESEGAPAATTEEAASAGPGNRAQGNAAEGNALNDRSVPRGNNHDQNRVNNPGRGGSPRGGGDLYLPGG
jgi:AAA domain